jgi:HD superfamily phosphohydrolase
MPKWGLSQVQIAAEPWGLPHELLRPDKIITNSVQGDVYLNRLERLFMDSSPMQRLRRIRQLGTTHLVYPDATHTRFSHSLGTLRSAQDLLDVVLDQQNRREPQPDLFAEWIQRDPSDYDKRIAEVVTLTRLGALLHDVCHVPFGHTIEDDLSQLDSHDGNARRFERLWGQFTPEIRRHITPDLQWELRHLILSKEEQTKQSEYPFVADLVGNTICADLIDYLQRDHRHLGLPLELGHRFLEGMYVTTSDHPHYAQRVVVELQRRGQDRSDVISELLKYLRYRYEESERALTHHAKLAADAMIGKLLAMWRDDLWVEHAGTFVPLTDDLRKDVDRTREFIQAVGDEELREIIEREEISESGDSPSTPQDQLIRFIDHKVVTVMEESLAWHGDDGLLEAILKESYTSAGRDSRRAAMVALCSGVLERNLYKRIGRSLAMDRDLAMSIWTRFGSPDERRRLELEAGRFLGLKNGWHFVLWIPKPTMGLKVAEVLVGGGSHVSTLHSYSQRVREIYDSHEDLWAVSVYVHPELLDDKLKVEVLLAWLRERLGLRGWVGPAPTENWQHVAVKHFSSTENLPPSEQNKILKSAAAARGGTDSLDGFMEAIKAQTRTS